MQPTPILNLLEDFPAAPKRRASSLIGVVLGIMIVGIAILRDEGILPQWPVPPFQLLWFFPALLFSILIHELGHALGGASVGLGFGGLAAGPLILFKSSVGWRVRWNWKAIWGGSYRPLSGEHGFRPRAGSFMIACGPLANLTLAFVCVALWLRDPQNASNWWGTVLYVSILLFAGNVIPFSTGSNKSDGARFRQLLLRPQEAQSWVALMELQSEDARFVWPADWNASSFEAIMKFGPDANEYSYCQWLCFYRSLNLKNHGKALVHLEAALARSAESGMIRQLLCQDAAFASAAILGNAEQARTWRERAIKIQKPQSLSAVDAAIAMAEQDYAGALEHFAAARARITKDKLDSGMIRFALAEWNRYETLCRAAPQNSIAAGKM